MGKEINIKGMMACIILSLIIMVTNACNSEYSTVKDVQVSDSINAKVKFNHKLMVNGKVASFFFGGTISTYGNTAIAQSNGSTQIKRLQELGLDGYRIPLKWNNGNIISSAIGGPSHISGDTWIAKLKEIGGEIVVVIGGKSTDNDISPQDAANMVRYFRNNNTPIKYWIIGNEPSTNGKSIQQYCEMFNQVADSMKSADSSIKIGGPAWAYYDLNILRIFIRMSGSRTDFIDYHHYAMGEFSLSEEEALRQTVNYEKEIHEIRDMIKKELPGAENKIEIQVGEYHWSHKRDNGFQGWNGDDRFYKAVTTIWTSTVAGLIAKAGGRSFQYSDLNGALGLTFENDLEASHFNKRVNDPTPVYHGLFMFTGGNLFRHFGNEFAVSSTSLTDVDIFASTSKNIVLVNKNASHAKVIRLRMEGIDSDTKADIWQTTQAYPFNTPVNKGSHAIKKGRLTYTLPPYSVTTIVIR